jgi:hypothetical protein
METKTSIRERASNELKAFVILTVYFYACFGALIFYKFAILEAQGVGFAPWGIAIIKAAICAKFMLVGRAFHIGEQYNRHPLIVPTLFRSFSFLALLVVLNVIEEIVVGAVHGRAILDSIVGIAGGPQQMAAASVILLLILIPYFALRSLADVIGDRTLARLFFEPRRRAAARPGRTPSPAR